MLRKPRLSAISMLCIFLGLLAAGPAGALFAPSPSVPTERLINNLTAYLKENPKDPEAHYLLARVHYMTFVNRVDHVRSNDPGSDEKLPRLVDPRQYGKAKGEKIDEAKAIEHARAAIRSFRKAIELKEGNALYHLGLASLFEQAAPHAEKIGPLDTLKVEEDKGVDEEKADLSKTYIAAALENHLTAYYLDRDAAIKKDSIFLPFYPVAYEAGKAVLRLIEDHEVKVTDDKVAGQIKQDIKTIDGKPMAITPIVLRIQGDTPNQLEELLAIGKTVRFDLDADGVAEVRPWVKPDTALLVWDPENTGKITSGEQLFGNMTFRMLFSDGYRALDALDDNRDGQLANDELKGLALWHDRNTNGISEPGEVTPIKDTPVRSIRTQATAKYGVHPMNDTGVTLDDGSTRPTWDWIIPGDTSEAGAEAGQ